MSEVGEGQLQCLPPLQEINHVCERRRKRDGEMIIWQLVTCCFLGSVCFSMAEVPKWAA